MKPDNYSDIWGMISKIDYPLTREEIKEQLCDLVTNGRTTSLQDLSARELGRLRKELKERTCGATDNMMLKRKRSIVLRKLNAYGVDTGSWKAINDFVRDKRIAGKPFRELTISELRKLEKKMSAIIANSKKVKRQKPEEIIESKVSVKIEFKVIKNNL